MKVIWIFIGLLIYGLGWVMMFPQHHYGKDLANHRIFTRVVIFEPERLEAHIAGVADPLIRFAGSPLKRPNRLRLSFTAKEFPV